MDSTQHCLRRWELLLNILVCLRLYFFFYIIITRNLYIYIPRNQGRSADDPTKLRARATGLRPEFSAPEKLTRWVDIQIEYSYVYSHEHSRHLWRAKVANFPIHLTEPNEDASPLTLSTAPNWILPGYSFDWRQLRPTSPSTATTLRRTTFAALCCCCCWCFFFLCLLSAGGPSFLRSYARRNDSNSCTEISHSPAATHEFHVFVRTSNSRTDCTGAGGGRTQNDRKEEEEEKKRPASYSRRRKLTETTRPAADMRAAILGWMHFAARARGRAIRRGLWVVACLRIDWGRVFLCLLIKFEWNLDCSRVVVGGGGGRGRECGFGEVGESLLYQRQRLEQEKIDGKLWIIRIERGKLMRFGRENCAFLGFWRKCVYAHVDDLLGCVPIYSFIPLSQIIITLACAPSNWRSLSTRRRNAGRR